MTKYFTGMGKDVTLEVLKWKECYDACTKPPENYPEKICEEKTAEEIAAVIPFEKIDKSKKRKIR